MTPRFNFWLGRARRFQEETYGTPIGDLEGKEWASYIRTNFLAAHTELSEAIQHLQWKPWRGGEHRPDPVNRDLAMVELIDALFFISNILVALGVTDDDLNAAYERKAAVNKRRQEEQ